MQLKIFWTDPIGRQRHQQLRLFDFPEDPLLDEIRQLNVDEMTPREAMDELYRLHQEIARRDDG